MPPAAEGIESPYDPEARFRSRHEIIWTGYQVHLSETCDPDEVHLITNVETTQATVHESRKTEAIHQALADKALPPDQHLVDSAYVDADVLISSREQFGISLVGPGRPDVSWQARTEGAYHRYCFAIDWEQRQVRCPQGKVWQDGLDRYGPRILVTFDSDDCLNCPARSLCTRAKAQPRRLRIQPRPQYEALQAARQLLTTQRRGSEEFLAEGNR